MKNFAECFVLVAMGFFIGYLTCNNSTQTRYVRALAERHESESHYWLSKINNEIQENKGDIQKERNNGKSN